MMHSWKVSGFVQPSKQVMTWLSTRDCAPLSNAAQSTTAMPPRTARAACAVTRSAEPLVPSPKSTVNAAAPPSRTPVQYVPGVVQLHDGSAPLHVGVHP